MNPYFEFVIMPVISHEFDLLFMSGLKRINYRFYTLLTTSQCRLKNSTVPISNFVVERSFFNS